MMKKNFVLMTVLMSAALLSGCSNVTKQKLGLTKQAPDEFMVMSRAPLSLPPEYDLRPVNDMSELKAADMNERMSGLDASEQKLLSKIDAQNSDEDIKAKIEQEFKELNASN